MDVPTTVQVSLSGIFDGGGGGSENDECASLPKWFANGCGAIAQRRRNTYNFNSTPMRPSKEGPKTRSPKSAFREAQGMTLTRAELQMDDAFEASYRVSNIIPSP